MEPIIINKFLQVAAFLLAYLGIKNVIDSSSASFSDLASSSVFRDIVISLLATLGLYLISSLLFVRDNIMMFKFEALLIELFNTI